MKKVNLMIAALLLIIGGATAQGIAFEEEGTPFADILAKAKAENKMVFMDCYTTWCGPCKKIAKEIFPLKEVGDYFNDKFVSIQMDMEKGEGPDLGKRYGVQAYPTLLFIDPSGKEIHRALGASDADSFIADAKITFDPSKQIAALDERYAMGDRDVDFLYDYAGAKASSMDQQGVYNIVKEFVDNAEKEDLISEKAFTMLSMPRGRNVIEYGSDQYYHLMDNKDKLIAMPQVGEQRFYGVISSSQVDYIAKQAKEVESIEELNEIIETATVGVDYGPNMDRLRGDMHANFYLANKQYNTWYTTKRKGVEDRIAVMAANAPQGPPRGGNMAGRMYSRIYQDVADNPAFDEADESFLAEVAKDCQGMMDKDPENLGGYYTLVALYVKMEDKGKALKIFDTYTDKLKEKGYWNPDSPNHSQIDKLQKSIEAL